VALLSREADIYTLLLHNHAWFGQAVFCKRVPTKHSENMQHATCTRPKSPLASTPCGLVSTHNSSASVRECVCVNFGGRGGQTLPYSAPAGRCTPCRERFNDGPGAIAAVGGNLYRVRVGVHVGQFAYCCSLLGGASLGHPPVVAGGGIIHPAVVAHAAVAAGWHRPEVLVQAIPCNTALRRDALGHVESLVCRMGGGRGRESCWLTAVPALLCGNRTPPYSYTNTMRPHKTNAAAIPRNAKITHGARLDNRRKGRLGVVVVMCVLGRAAHSE